MANVTLTNMCMIYDKENNKVLVQNRVKSWKGITFPGGHVEKGESIVESTIREIKEETGLTISNLEPCGIIQWYNKDKDESYFVFNYRTSVYSGKLLHKTDEGDVFWVHKNELAQLQFAEGMEERLPMFFEKAFVEGFYDEGQLKRY